MAIAFVNSVLGWSTSTNGFTTSSIDTTGGDLLVAIVTELTAVGTVTDSKSNTWHKAETITVNGDHTGELWYAYSATCGTSHTFSLSGSGSFPAIIVMAFSGSYTAGDPLDDSTIEGDFGTDAQPGPITPSQAGCLAVTGLGPYNPGITVATYPSGYTTTGLEITDGAFGHFEMAAAYKIQTTASTENPLWSVSGFNFAIGSLGIFKSSVGAGVTAVASLGARGTCAGAKSTNPTLPAQDAFDSGPSTLDDPPWNQIGGDYFISQGLGPSNHWAAAGLSSGGFSTVGLDQFTDTASTPLSDHTANTGGTWEVASFDDPLPTSAGTINSSGHFQGVSSQQEWIHYSVIPSTFNYQVSCDLFFDGTPVGGEERIAVILNNNPAAGYQADTYMVGFNSSDGIWFIGSRRGFGLDFEDATVADDTGFSVGESRHMRVEMNDSFTISLYVDDDLKLSFTDTSPLDDSTTCGIYYSNGANRLTMDNFIIQEGSVGTVGGPADSLYIWDDDEVASDQYSQVVIKSTPLADTTQYMILMVRVDPVTTDLYLDGTGYVLYTDGGSSTYIHRRGPGSVTEIARDDTITWGASDVLRLEVVSDEVTFYINDVSKLTVTDATITSGQPGIGGFATSEILFFDDFEADIAGGSSIDLSGAAVGRAGARPTIVTRKQGASTDTAKAGARVAAQVARKQGAATPTAQSGARATCAGTRSVTAAGATARSAAKVTTAGQSSKSALAFTGARAVAVGVRPVSATLLGSVGIQASTTTGKVVSVALGAARIGIRAQISPYIGTGSMVLSQPTVVLVPAPFTYNVTITGINTTWTEDTTWTITPASAGPSLASSSIIVSSPTLASWIFTLGPGTGSFTISDGTNNAILVVLPQSFTITPTVKVWVPTADQAFALVGAGTAWTDDTTWTITSSGTVSLAASQIIVTDTTHATWTVTLGPGNSGTFTLSDGSISSTVTIVSGIAVTVSAGPRGLNSGRKSVVQALTAKDGVRAASVTQLVGANSVITRTGARVANVQRKQGIATPVVRGGARSQNVIVQIKVVAATGKLGAKVVSAVVKQGKAQPTLRTAVRGTTQYVKQGLFAANEHIGVQSQNATASVSARVASATAVSGVKGVCTGRAQFASTNTARLGTIAFANGRPVTPRSAFGSIGSVSQTTGIKGGLAGPVAATSAVGLCSGSKLGVQSAIGARGGFGVVNVNAKQGIANPTVSIGAVAVIDAPQAHAKPLLARTGVRAIAAIAGNKASTSGIGRAGAFSRVAGLGNQDKTAIAKFGARSRMTADATVGPVVENIPAILRAGDRARATLRAWDALRR